MVDLEPVHEEEELMQKLHHHGGDLEWHGRVDISGDMTRHDDERLHQLISNHLHYTGSSRAKHDPRQLGRDASEVCKGHAGGISPGHPRDGKGPRFARGGGMRNKSMKLASAIILVALTSAPAFAAGPQAAIVLHYRNEAGVEGPVVYTTMPVGSFDMAECKKAFRSMVSQFKLNNRVNPQYAKMKFLGAKCELYTDELLSRAGKFNG
jgi:hypothetical protein